jgi:flavodoxin
MTKCLVAYYSWNGNTAKVARALAEFLSADVEEIRDAKRRSGFFAFLRSASEASREKPAPILPLSRNAGDYDILILGSPVWAQKMASPVRSYILRERQRVKNLALFCTLGGAGGETVLASMEAACGRRPVANLQVREADFKSGAWKDLVEDFARRILEGAPKVSEAAA